MAKGTVDKWKSKKWFSILAPKMFNSRQIGQTIAIEPKKMIGRVIQINLGELTGDYNSRQRVTVKFKIDSLQGNDAITKFLGHAIPPESLRAMMRKRSAKIYVNQKVRTRDNKEFTVKSSIIVDRKATRSNKTAIGKKFEEFVAEEARNTKFIDLMSNLINNRIAITAKKELHKIYPVKQVVIEKTEIAENVELPDEPVARIRQRRRPVEGGAPERRDFRPQRGRREEKVEEKKPEEKKEEPKIEEKQVEEKKTPKEEEKPKE